jgi:hypothetical protein
VAGWVSRSWRWITAGLHAPATGTAAAPAEAAKTSTTNPYQAGSDRVRQTATWLVGALAAVATVMLAGSQLSSIGSLSFEDNPGRLGVAIGSALLVVAAVSFAVYRLTEIQMPREGTLGQIRRAAQQSSRLQELAEGDSGLRAGRPNLAQFIDDYEGLRQKVWDAEKAVIACEEAVAGAGTTQERETATALLSAARAAHGAAAERVAALRPRMVELAQLSAYLDVRERFARERNRIMLAALGAAALLVCFAWAANPAQPAAESTDALLPKPSSGRLFLTPAGLTELGSLLGASCAENAAGPQGVAVVALAAGDDSVDVVVLPEAGCVAPARITVTTAQGQVVASRTVPLPTATTAAAGR